MHAASQAVRGGRQRAATCGLHAVNHCLHALGRVITWDEFDGKARADERRVGGDWEAAVLHRNAAAAGANMQPIVGAEHQVLAQWHPDMARLGLWGPETLGCVVHVPGHWVALTRPEGAQTEQAAALLCDSLHQQPFAFSAAEVGQLFSAMAQWQQVASLARVQEWSIQRITLRQGVLP